MSLTEVMTPAIDLAEQGFELSRDTATAIVRREKRLRGHAYSESLFFRADKTPYQGGDRFRQPDLAETLRRIATQGPDVFYRGDIARLIVAEMQRGNGLITMADMAAYRVVEREPVSGTYKGYRVLSMPPPSSGGIHLVQLLNVLEYFPLDELGHNSAATIHIMAEAMKYAYADRSEYLGDPDYYPVPVNWLTDKGYAGQIAKKIEPGRARPSTEIAPGRLPAAESPDTTHYSVIDAAGNAVATTYTLNFSFGSGISVPGAGFLLNNEMADFSAKPGVPNAFGLLGNEANAVEGGKRPLSAMTPTIVLRDGKPYLVTGTPGGSRIITSVLQHVVNVLEFDMNVAAANHASRIHHQWYPDNLLYETGIGPDTLKLLKSFGQNVQKTNTMGSVQAIVFDGQQFQGSDDPRRPNAGAVAVQR
jgi:gamma-glutamyltranspeptidase/glutathione hydrolase